MPSENPGRLFHGDVAGLIRHPLFPGAPTCVHAIGRALQEGVDLGDQALLELEDLGDLPGVWLHRTGLHIATAGRLELACLAARMIEEAEGEHDAALLVDGHEATIADAVDE